MFNSDEIRERIRRQPFVPLRIVTSSGETFDVYHPDLVMVGQRSIIVGTASTQDPRTYELASRLAIGHITALEDLPSPSAPYTDGPQ